MHENLHTERFSRRGARPPVISARLVAVAHFHKRGAMNEQLKKKKKKKAIDLSSFIDWRADKSLGFNYECWP